MELQEAYGEFETRGVEILAISTNVLNDAADIVERIGIQFPVLYNPAGDVPRGYGVFDHFGDGLAVGSVFLIDINGSLRWSRVYTHIYDFVPSNEVLAEVDALYALTSRSLLPQ